MPHPKLQVALRVRDTQATHQKPTNLCLDLHGRNCRVKDPYSVQNYKDYKFSHIFNSCNKLQSELNPLDSQDILYQDIGKRILWDTFDGINSCLLAYGQSGSGKTHSLFGSPSNHGILPRICADLFDHISHSPPSLSYTVEIACVEVYNEKVFDVLRGKNNATKQHPNVRVPMYNDLRVREHPETGPYVENLTKHPVQTVERLLQLLTVVQQRQTSTASRPSHFICFLTLHQHAATSRSGSPSYTATKSGGGTDHHHQHRVSVVTVADLCGIDKCFTETDYGHQPAAAAAPVTHSNSTKHASTTLSRSLTCLSRVISLLAKSKSKRTQTFVPWRDSVLTWLLKEKLSGNCRSCLLATVSPWYKDYEQTLATLQFADRAKRITTNLTVDGSYGSSSTMVSRGDGDGRRDVSTVLILRELTDAVLDLQRQRDYIYRLLAYRAENHDHQQQQQPTHPHHPHHTADQQQSTTSTSSSSGSSASDTYPPPTTTAVHGPSSSSTPSSRNRSNSKEPTSSRRRKSKSEDIVDSGLPKIPIPATPTATTTRKNLSTPPSAVESQIQKSQHQNRKLSTSTPKGSSGRVAHNNKDHAHTATKKKPTKSQSASISSVGNSNDNNNNDDDDDDDDGWDPYESDEEEQDYGVELALSGGDMSTVIASLNAKLEAKKREILGILGILQPTEIGSGTSTSTCTTPPLSEGEESTDDEDDNKSQGCDTPTTSSVTSLPRLNSATTTSRASMTSQGVLSSNTDIMEHNTQTHPPKSKSKGRARGTKRSRGGDKRVVVGIVADVAELGVMRLELLQELGITVTLPADVPHDNNTDIQEEIAATSHHVTDNDTSHTQTQESVEREQMAMLLKLEKVQEFLQKNQRMYPTTNIKVDAVGNVIIESNDEGDQQVAIPKGKTIHTVNHTFERWDVEKIVTDFVQGSLVLRRNHLSLTTALRAAVSCDEIYVHPGTYYGPFKLVNNVTLKSVLTNGTNVVLTGVDTTVAKAARSTENRPNEAVMTIQCNSGIMSGFTIHADNTQSPLVVRGGNVVIEHCNIYGGNVKSCVHIKNGANPTLKNCQIHGAIPHGIGVWITEAGGNIMHNDIYGNGDCGIVVEGGTANPNIQYNNIHNGKGGGIGVCRGSTTYLYNNHIHLNACSGLVVEDAANPKVIENEISECGGGGVVVSDDHTTGYFSKNNIHHNEQRDIHVTKLANPTFEYNNIYAGAGYGIVVSNGGRGLFKHNVCKGYQDHVMLVRTRANPVFVENTIDYGNQHGVLVYENGSGRYEQNKVTGHDEEKAFTHRETDMNMALSGNHWSGAVKRRGVSNEVGTITQ